MKLLLTGAAGFIGSHVRGLLQQRGHEVTGVDCYLPQVHGHSPREVSGVRRAVVGAMAAQWSQDPNLVYDAVVHLAAEVGIGQSQYEPARYIRGNVAETADLWEAIIKHRSHVRKVVVASSMSVYGEGSYEGDGDGPSTYRRFERAVERGWDAFDHVRADGTRTAVPGLPRPVPTRESKIPEPRSVYAQSKLDTEAYSRLLGAAYEIPTVALRFFNTYGPGQALINPYTGVLASFACRVLNGQPPLIFEDGQQVRDFVFVTDVADAIVAAVEKEDLIGTYNVCTSVPTTVSGLAEQWNRVAGHFGIAPQAPRILQRFRKGDVRACYGDPTAFHHATGWRAHVSLAEGLLRTAQWVLRNGLHKHVPVDHSGTALAELRQMGVVTG
jgi:dTDP-L-rhamnose 4-epimerase